MESNTCLVSKCRSLDSLVCEMVGWQVLWLSDNGIRSISRVDSLPMTLKELCLSGNPITKITQNLTHLSNLQSLFLSKTSIWNLMVLYKR